MNEKRMVSVTIQMRPLWQCYHMIVLFVFQHFTRDIFVNLFFANLI